MARFSVFIQTESLASAETLSAYLWERQGLTRLAGESKHLTHFNPVVDARLYMLWEYRARGSNSDDVKTIIKKRAAEKRVHIVDAFATSIAKAHCGYGGHVMQRAQRMALVGRGRDLDCCTCEAVVEARKTKLPFTLSAKLGDTVVIDRVITECPLHGEQWLGDS